MRFTVHELEKLITSGSFDDLELIQQKILGRTRENWMKYELVFYTQRKYYKTTYSLPAFYPEYAKPFGENIDEVECVEVLPVEATVIEYLPVRETKPTPRPTTVGFQLP